MKEMWRRIKEEMQSEARKEMIMLRTVMRFRVGNVGTVPRRRDVGLKRIQQTVSRSDVLRWLISCGVKHRGESLPRVGLDWIGEDCRERLEDGGHFFTGAGRLHAGYTPPFPTGPLPPHWPQCMTWSISTTTENTVVVSHALVTFNLSASRISIKQARTLF